MKRRSKTKQWHKRHVEDHWVKQATQSGYRSRAAYKLLEIQKTEQMIKPDQVLIDLGAAPGGWSQIAAECLQGRGQVIAIDLLEMGGLPGVQILKGDFCDQSVQLILDKEIANRPVAGVMSDMSPNLSGVRVADQARAMHLTELALEFAEQYLVADGFFLVKVFQGEGFEQFVRQMRSVFLKVKTKKPKASRDSSREIYLLGLGLRSGAMRQ